MPLGSDVVQLSEHSPADQMHCVVVENTVVALVAGGQVQRFARWTLQFLGKTRHDLALSDIVGHEFLGKDVLTFHHRLDGNRSVQVQWQGDDDRFDAIVVEQSLDAPVGRIVNLDIPASFFLSGVLVLFDQTRSRRGGPVAVERAVDAVGPNIGNGRDLDVLRGTTADKYVAFITRADDANSDRIGKLFVSEVHRP